MRRRYLISILLCLPAFVFSQQYTGMSGLIHVPSADMDNERDVRIGSHFLNKQFLPDEAFDYKGKYHSADFYVSITPFARVEIGYTFTLRKGNREYFAPNDIGYHRKDQYISLKVQPLKEKEGKWWPSVAIGTNDPKTGTHKKDADSEKNKNQHFGNY